MKAQTELLGMVMVVLLLSIALVFVIVFVVLVDSNDPSDEFRDKQLAFYLNSVMLETNTACNGLPLKRVIEDCYGQFRIQACGPVPQTSCQYANDVITDMLDKTIEPWYIDYIYTVKKRDSSGTDVTPPPPRKISRQSNIGSLGVGQDSCPPGRDQLKAPILLPSFDGSQIITELTLCR